VKLYLAGRSLNCAIEGDLYNDLGATRILRSFPYCVAGGPHCGDFSFWAGIPGEYSSELLPRPRGELFMDSGAFTAATTGATINLASYCRFLHGFKSRIAVYAVLDVIGNHVATARNQKAMEAEGLHPLPVAHVGAPMAVLKRQLNAGHQRIALGGMAIQPAAEATLRWEGKAWEVLRDWPQVKVHCFGSFVPSRLMAYPYHSADWSFPVLGPAWGHAMRFEPGPPVRLITMSRISQIQAAIAEGMPWLADKIARRVPGTRMRGYIARRVYTFKQILKYEKYLTDLWAARGVEW